jgi:hypothetical protein
MLELIKELQNTPLFNDFYLVGGTALALQLGHRTSTDIDLFSYTHTNFFDISMYFHKNPEKYQLNKDQEGFIRAYINGIKVEFVYDDVGKLLKQPINVDGIICLDKSEIATMKLNAIASRNTIRDFIDIAYLLREMSLEDMFKLYKEKYGSVNINILKRELLTKSRAIKEDDSLDGIKIIRDDIKLQDIPEIIKRSIEEYNYKNGIGLASEAGG